MNPNARSPLRLALHRGLATAARPILLTGLLAGCAGEPHLSTRTVLEFDQCQGIDAGLSRVRTHDLAGIRGSTLLRMTNGGSKPDPATAGAADRAADEPLLIAVSRGRQPTSGYRLSLEDAVRQGNTGLLRLNWEVPPSGSVLPQVMTHPCLVVSVDPQGLARVEARDQTGAVIGALELSR